MASTAGDVPEPYYAAAHITPGALAPDTAQFPVGATSVQRGGQARSLMRATTAVRMLGSDALLGDKLQQVQCKQTRPLFTILKYFSDRLFVFQGRERHAPHRSALPRGAASTQAIAVICRPFV